MHEDCAESLPNMDYTQTFRYIIILAHRFRVSLYQSLKGQVKDGAKN